MDRINIFRVVRAVHEKVKENFGEPPQEDLIQPALREEEDCADRVFDILRDLTGRAAPATVNTVNTLEVCESDEDMVEDQFDDHKLDPSYQHEDKTFDYLTPKSMNKIRELYDGGRSAGSIMKLYPKVKNRAHLQRIIKYVESAGNKRQLISVVKKHVKKLFKDARSRDLPVHDRDLIRWARSKAREVGLESFKASKHFITDLKREMKVRSRKVTHVVTTRRVYDETEIMQSAANYVATVNSTLDTYDVIINADQSGFLKEFSSSRTLSNIGEKKTFVQVTSKSKNTHTYTIMPAITSSGELLSPLYVCLQETTGDEFGPIVSAQLKKNVPPNLHVSCSKSGKMSKKHMRTWAEKCARPNVSANGRTLVMLDSWSGQSREFTQQLFDDIRYAILSEQEEHPEDCQCAEEMEITVSPIPPGTTALCQPNDVFFLRQWKVLVRAIYDRISLDSIPIPQDRMFLLTVQSLVHNQLQAKIFNDMIRYAFQRAGYQVPHVENFKAVNQVCFAFTDEEVECEADECPESIFIKCAHCQKCLCLEHFLRKVCFH